MLTEIQYEDLWVNPAPNGFGMPLHLIPNYYQYLQREVYFQDYLDLFRRKSNETFPRVEDNYVDPGFVILHDPTYTKIINGKVYLKVDYDFPYKDELCKNRCIKYIMIGEAAPALNVPIYDVAGNDKANTYFYNTKHIRTTGYFSAPCTSFGIIGVNKTEKLVDLANNGVILIDLFPFACSYNDLRDIIVRDEIDLDFWQNIVNPYSLINRLNSINESFCNSNENIDSVKGCLVLPPKISHNLAEKLNLGHIGNLGLNFRMGENIFAPLLAPPPRNLYYFLGIAGLVLNGVYIIPPTLNNAPIYACAAYSGSGLVPHELFIRNAFYLP